ncbi:hypothetical protein FA95DRAFT_1613661 [Auriscalpium vulgare]|uniref:Uncharacterized protein n=1 Tax=Auriscalpium vulgare TaxID=40419 RepID=A0ACB8R2B4_9AGAM|nr:hypothetical protein FA95DRAFT_1613661 [Auriscalpium vulgare]
MTLGAILIADSLDSREKMPAFPFPLAFWTSADESDTVVIAANTSFIPCPMPPDPPQSVHVQSNGLWGMYEWTRIPQSYDISSPYLAYINVPHHGTNDILTDSVDKTMWTPLDKDAGHRRTMADKVREPLHARLNDAWKVSNAIFPQARRHKPVAHVTIPDEALRRARDGYYRLEDGVHSWDDFVDLFRAAQRGLLEVFAFRDWWEDVKNDILKPAGSAPPIRPSTRGSIVTSIAQFHDYHRMNVAVYMTARAGQWDLPRARWRFPSPLHDRGRLTGPRSVTEKHTKPLWFYPPHVMHVRSFESAARGHCPREDSLNPSDEYQASMEIVKGPKQKRGRATQNRDKLMHLKEIRRSSDIANSPAYFPPVSMLYFTAKWTNPPSLLRNDESVSRQRRIFPHPPYYLFWGAQTEEKQMLYFTRYVQLFPYIRDRHLHVPDGGVRGINGLDTKDWREILGDTYWKRCWPLPSVGTPYDPAVFYRYGGRLLFGAEVHGQIIAGDLNPIQTMACGCPVTPELFRSSQLRYSVIAQSLLCSIADELHALEHTIRATSSFVRSGSFDEVVSRFIWPFGADSLHGWEVINPEGRREWLDTVREIVSAWPIFDSYPWRGYTAAELRALTFHTLSRDVYVDVEGQLLACYVRAFMVTFGWYPSPWTPRPIFTEWKCSTHMSEMDL